MNKNADNKPREPLSARIKARAERLLRDIPALFLALKDRETPFIAKLLAAVAVVYALSPVDLIPDFIPVLGYLDDIIILPGLVALTVRMIPREVFERCRAESEGMWKNGKPEKWYYAVPVVLIYLAVIALIIFAFVK